MSDPFEVTALCCAASRHERRAAHRLQDALDGLLVGAKDERVPLVLQHVDGGVRQQLPLVVEALWQAEAQVGGAVPDRDGALDERRVVRVLPGDHARAVLQHAQPGEAAIVPRVDSRREPEEVGFKVGVARARALLLEGEVGLRPHVAHDPLDLHLPIDAAEASRARVQHARRHHLRVAQRIIGEGVVRVEQRREEREAAHARRQRRRQLDPA
mmetsp:Transcript_71808/g.196698  ORF Transcript_71808/g.196698 Transcript_71808/m.196698 type:complete len:213 (+) Transcript_71808:181-819(+)